MNTVEIIIIIAAVCILTADFAVRLVIAPRKREHYVADLLSILYGPGATSGSAALPARSGNPPDRLGEGLLRHFTQSWLSCRIVDILATNNAGLREVDILTEINVVLMEKGRRPLPEIAVRKVLMILMGAGFVILEHGALLLTKQGRDLHSVLLEHRCLVAVPPQAAF